MLPIERNLQLGDQAYTRIIDNDIRCYHVLQAGKLDETRLAAELQLLAGYMARREANLLQEQERTRLALERARTRDTN